MSAPRLHARVVDRYNKHTKVLRPMDVGDVILVQNQTGLCPRRWDLTGVVVETLDYRQYRISVHGSGRITLRNHRLIRLLKPFADTERKATVAVRPVSTDATTVFHATSDTLCRAARLPTSRPHVLNPEYLVRLSHPDHE